MLLSTGVDAAVQRRINSEFSIQNFSNIEALPTILPAARAAGERLRIGYFSNDFHNHATSMLIARVFELHDRSRFETRLYSYGPDDRSVLRRRIEAAGDAFIDVSGLSDRETAHRIRADGIDVLIDLKGFTFKARTNVLAMRPAPIQVAYLGYPATMGAGFIDYAIVDPIVLPPEKADEFTERLAWMPDSYQPNDQLRPIAQVPSRADVGLPESAFVFCCFNNTYKILPEVFDVWCRLLAGTPNSVLWQLAKTEASKSNLRREVALRGIDPDRLIFAPPVAPEHNLARIGLADLFLDTLPYNAHTTASDALWVGVPLVTCRGNAFAGRVAASLLHAVGLPELVTDSLADYEALALEIAHHPTRHAALKAHLRTARETAPLFDSLRTTRSLEELYLRMADRWRAGLPPDHLHVQGPGDAAASGRDTPA
jgi:predicted O-linked N-acetylglucosamine transferase (SPINDLY family)